MADVKEASLSASQQVFVSVGVVGCRRSMYTVGYSPAISVDPNRLATLNGNTKDLVSHFSCYLTSRLLLMIAHVKEYNKYLHISQHKNE